VAVDAVAVTVVVVEFVGVGFALSFHLNDETLVESRREVCEAKPP